MDLSRRSTTPEEMDAETTTVAEYARCLRDLAGVNRITLTHRATLRWLTRATRDLPQGGHIGVLDVACGHGDLLRAIRRWADRRGLNVMLEGIDLNPRSAEVARAATAPEMAVRYRTGDVFAFVPHPLPDLIVSSQFAHHLTDDDVVQFLHWLDRYAARGWFIADLHRHALAYYGFPLLARLAGWHRIVRQDGQISIARGFRRAEWERLLAQAGIKAGIRWSFPFRYCIGCLK
jgi:SAM-dependent methyltransferase